MRLGRGKLVFQRTSLVFLLRAGESRLSEKERSGFELRPVVWSLFYTRKVRRKPAHEQEAERTANGSGLSKSRMSAWRRAYTFAGYGDTLFAIS